MTVLVLAVMAFLAWLVSTVAGGAGGLPLVPAVRYLLVATGCAMLWQERELFEIETISGALSRRTQAMLRSAAAGRRWRWQLPSPNP